MAFPPYVHHSVPNRSLGAAGRRWFLGSIACATLAVACFATALGAWPVMPFAGFEVFLVFLAFRVVALHDADFERVEIGEHEVRVESRSARQVTRLVANRPWTRLLVKNRGRCCTLQIAYAGRVVPLGRLLSDDGRRELARELRARIAVAAN